MGVRRVIYKWIENSHEFIIAGAEELFQEEASDLTNFSIGLAYHDHQGSWFTIYSLKLMVCW